LAVKETAKEACGRRLIATRLHEDIHHIAILINRPPQLVLLPLNRNKDLIKVPGVTQPSLSSFEFPSIVRTKFLTPLATGRIGDRDASFSKQLFDFTEAQSESMVEPNRVTDNF
jgi:hypothetical protein